MAISDVKSWGSAVVFPVCMRAGGTISAGLVLSQICYFFERQKKGGKRPIDQGYAKKWVNPLKLLEKERLALADDLHNLRRRRFLMPAELRQELLAMSAKALEDNPKTKGYIEFLALPPDRLQTRLDLAASTIAAALKRLRNTGMIYQVKGNNRWLKQRNATIVRPRWIEIFRVANGGGFNLYV